MRYYRTGMGKTTQLSWHPMERRSSIFYANQTISNMFSPSMAPGSPIRTRKGFVQVGGTYFGSINFTGTASCCNVGPDNNAKVQYRAYGCYPMTYQQLMNGVLITPGQKWAQVRTALNISPTESALISIVAFLIPSPNDRNRRGLRPTFSNPLGSTSWKVTLAPRCVPDIWGNNKHCEGAVPGFGIDHIRKPCRRNNFPRSIQFK
jgi:hypothetical protein